MPPDDDHELTLDVTVAGAPPARQAGQASGGGGGGGALTGNRHASAPLAVSPGSNAAVVTYRGISIRVAYDYDIKYKQTVVSLDTLYGVKTLDASRAVLIKGANKA